MNKIDLTEKDFLSYKKQLQVAVKQNLMALKFDRFQIEEVDKILKKFEKMNKKKDK